ncbi:hypothetical protein TVNIR_1695 [Thioalkalivibrio nitratireducens DSM 14787]|uniref:DUF433 domain-containing protein n=1 Tax=Thioalkalivibrio nitratireducens (strain DSM 14787 / UNIQEM 213 / ALEN2) TaxID=1255043 RepID=L0DUV0_THIND|nr:DUF433 domain-containing protein [Thioalkalivibrio nitratireducens]AGA33359.1 hypothetical protein TVNIR_1695 [Thioalkalivibrio nitratireducens DSM 14787]
MIPPGRIAIDPATCHGRPVIRGTRVPVSIVLGSLAAGMTSDEIKREYGLTDEDIQSAVLAQQRGLFDSPATPDPFPSGPSPADES